ncbi:MAG: hypothetical protein KDD10_14615 [Phaeodactylibacter sp.]|nr:hypothetical protein [Phaeodactylibacter sp.]
MQYLKKTALLAIILLPAMLRGQQDEQIVTSLIGSVECAFNLRQEILYIDKDDNREKKKVAASVNVKDVRTGIIPIHLPDYAKFRLTFQLDRCPDRPAEKKSELRVRIQRQGAFGKGESTETFVLKKNKDYKESYTIDIQRWGKAAITLTFLSIDGKNIEPEEASTRTYKYEVKVTGNLAELYSLPNNTVANKAAFVLKNAEAYDLYEFFLPDRYREAAGYDAIRQVLRNARERIDASYRELSQGSASAIDKFRVFGQPALKNYSTTKNHYESALADMKAAEEASYQKSAGPQSILELEKAFENYRKSFCTVEGYACRFKGQYNSRISGIIQEWAQSSGDKAAYCLDWEDIQNSEYFAAHSGDAVFAAARKTCDVVVDPCDRIASRSKRTSNINTLTKLLADSEKNGCGKALFDDIQQKIELLSCREKVERAIAETNIGVKRSLLKEVVDKAGCREVKAEAKALLDSIPLIEFDRDEGPLEAGRDSITGRRLYKYIVHFKSGRNLLLYQVDSVDIEQKLRSGEVRSVNWEEKDKAFHIIVDSNEKEYQLTFRSKATGEEAGRLLTWKQFKARIEEQGNLLIIELENGSAPYFARFFNEGGAFSMKLNAPRDTLDKGALAKNFPGAYAMQVVDNNGKTGGELPEVELSRGLQFSLWMALLLPLLFLTGFIIYRNIPNTDQ